MTAATASTATAMQAYFQAAARASERIIASP